MASESVITTPNLEMALPGDNQLPWGREVGMLARALQIVDAELGSAGGGEAAAGGELEVAGSTMATRWRAMLP